MNSIISTGVNFRAHLLVTGASCEERVKIAEMVRQAAYYDSSGECLLPEENFPFKQVVMETATDLADKPKLLLTTGGEAKIFTEMVKNYQDSVEKKPCPKLKEFSSKKNPYQKLFDEYVSKFSDTIMVLPVAKILSAIKKGKFDFRNLKILM